MAELRLVLTARIDEFPDPSDDNLATDTLPEAEIREQGTLNLGSW